MADAYTDFLNLTKPEVGGSRDAWGSKWNANADAISVWAKATDALAKDALPRTAVNKDAAGATIPWTVTPAVTFSGALTFSNGLSIPKNAKAFFGQGYVATTDDFTEIVTGPSNGFRIVNNAYSLELFRAAPEALYFKGTFPVWHTGNLTPADYISKKDTAEQTIVSQIVLNRPTPRISFIYPNVRSFVWGVREDGHLYAEDLTGNGQVFSVRSNGDLWTKPLGDVGTRIETRAAAYADDRLATARAEYGQAFQKTGGTITGDVVILKATPSLYLDYPSVKRGRWFVDANGNVIWQDNGGQNHFYVSPAGAVWTQQFGDLNTRIEARAQSFADDRLATARSEYTLKAAKTGDVFTGDIQVSKTNPAYRMNYPSVRETGWRVQDDGKTYLWDYYAANWIVNFGTDGSVVTKQFGDLTTRIDTRAANFADDRLTTATTRINNKSARLSFAQDVSIGDVGNSVFWEGVGGGVLTGFQQNGTTGQARAFRVRQLQMSDSNGSWYACGYI